MTGLTAERVRALQEWAAGLTPQEAVRARALARNCGNCVHFDPQEERPERVIFGLCRATGPSVHASPGTIGPTFEVRWPSVRPELRCGRWQDPKLPLTWTSALSGVELDRAARLMGVDLHE